MSHLMRNEVWFGTSTDNGWVPAPLANYNKAKVKWRSVDQLLHGGAFVRQSDVGHKTLSLTWPVQNQAGLARVLRVLEGNSPIFYIDPLEAQGNLVPSYWAEPAISVAHGPKLFNSVNNATVGTADDNTRGRPTRTWSGTLTSLTESDLRFPIPAGYQLHFGVHGTGTSQVTIGTGNELQSLMPVTDSRDTSFIANNTFTSGNVQWVTARFSAGTLNISSITARLVPTGQAPQHTGFQPGLGHTSLRLANDPTIVTYSVGLPNAQMGISAEFVETGAWEGTYSWT